MLLCNLPTTNVESVTGCCCNLPTTNVEGVTGCCCVISLSRPMNFKKTKLCGAGEGRGEGEMNIDKKILQKRAKFLRQTFTDAEHQLWYYLRGRRFGQYKFKRQVPIGKYIVDFVCHWKRMVIELDGGQHIETIDYDEKRTKFLESQGYRVFRFWNDEVLMEIENVLEIIWRALESR